MKSRLANCRLYGFIDTAYLAGRDPCQLTADLIAGGVDIIQVRAKNYTSAQRAELGRAVLSAATVPVIINDDIDVAREIGADGVHLGQEDWAAIRRRPPGLRILGISIHSLEQAQQAERDGADYIGVGPVFPTGTKPSVKPVGLKLVTQVAGSVTIPFFAIGGITLQNLKEVKAAGATRIAVVSAILQATEVAAAATGFKSRLS